MLKAISRLLVIVCACIFAGCVQYTLVKPGTVKVKSLSFNVENAWSKSPFNVGPNTALMTRDGLLLNRLIIAADVPSGSPMFKTVNKDTPMPKFNASLLPHELEEFIKTSLTNTGSDQEFKTSGLRPMKIGDSVGVAFDIQYFNPDGLLSKGKSIAIVKNEKLYSMIFLAASIHYYDEYVAEVERSFESLSW